MEGNDATTTRDLVTSLGARRTSRKRFLAEAAGLTGALVAAGLAHPEAANAAGTVRGVTAGTFFLELSRGGGGFVQSVAGGNITADVVDEQPASSFVPKHLGMPKFEEFVVKAGSGMSAEFYDWIHDAWNGTVDLKSGAVLKADFNGNILNRREFSSGFITKVTMPALDGASKDAASMLVRFLGVNYKDVNAGGKTPSALGTQKQWTAANFTLGINGIDTSKVNHIDAFTVDQGITDASREVDPNDVAVSVGAITPAFTLGYAPIDFPDLVVTFSAASAATWKAWFEDMVVKGLPSERDGVITYLDTTLKEVGHIDLHNVGIFDLVEVEDQKDTIRAIRRMRAHLYCERMNFVFSKPGKPPAP